MGDRGITYGLKGQARALVPQQGDKDRHRWLVGTNALREENEVQVLEFDSEEDTVRCAESYRHGPEIWSITPSPADPDALITVYNEGGTFRSTLWRLSARTSQLQQQTELTGHTGVIRAVIWHPLAEPALLSIEEGRLRKWALRDAGAEMVADASAGDLYQLWGGAWDPHDTNRLCTAGGNNIQLWDLRTLKKTGEIEGAHYMPVRDIDFAHRHEHQIVSGGDDCKLRFWDLRAGSAAKPLLELGGHSHWIWQTRYSPFHDQMVLSASSDALVNLWYTPSISSGPSSTGHVKPAQSANSSPARASFVKEPHDGKVRSYDDHEDSVYSVAWSAADPWVFASLSYDGRVAVNRVPSQIKYKILI
ncbi:hypothetical protein WJX72_008294 [[Myrmecia] bisecta]|uniref:EIPR1-like beta-propeller domain-containing protein n=1 Tax=[Myrmecia] bisecta TaxID=41462 RepID=A0AAW1Q4E1_9CHLO